MGTNRSPLRRGGASTAWWHLRGRAGAGVAATLAATSLAVSASAAGWLTPSPTWATVAPRTDTQVTQSEDPQVPVPADQNVQAPPVPVPADQSVQAPPVPVVEAPAVEAPAVEAPQVPVPVEQPARQPDQQPSRTGQAPAPAPVRTSQAPAPAPVRTSQAPAPAMGTYSVTYTLQCTGPGNVTISLTGKSNYVTGVSASPGWTGSGPGTYKVTATGTAPTRSGIWATVTARSSAGSCS